MRMPQIKTDVIYPDLSYKICGLCFSTHNSLGRFRSERSYADALEKLLRDERISYKRENSLPPSFESEKNRRNIPDFLIDNKIILDLKSKRIITKDDYYQMRRYLISGDKKLGIIVNFRPKYLVAKRVLNSQYSHNIR